MADVNTTLVLPRSLPRKARAATPGSNQDTGSIIPRTNTTLEFETVRQLRAQGRKIEAIRKLARIDGNVSSAVHNLVQAAMSGFKIKAYEAGTHQLSPEGTQLARSVMASINTLYDYSLKFSDKRTIDAIIETALREVVLTGATGIELILNKQRLPEKFAVIPYESLKWRKGSQGLYPVQTSSGGEIDLNIPTFWVVEAQLPANEAYSFSMMEGALDSAYYVREILEDMRRAVRRTGHARLVVTLDAEKVRASAPAEVQQDPVKLRAFMDSTRDEVVSVINSIEPEECLVSYDLVEVEALSADGEKADYAPLINLLTGLLATSLRTPPSILGLRLSGSQSLSNTESLIYLQSIGALQRPIEQAMSRAMTLATRLYGSDTYVEFRFNSVELRSEEERTPYKIMYQDMILEQLSLGLISDAQASEALGTGPKAPGSPDLSGTFFHEKNAGNIDAGDVSTNSDPMGRAISPSTPTKGGGSDN